MLNVLCPSLIKSRAPTLLLTLSPSKFLHRIRCSFSNTSSSANDGGSKTYIPIRPLRQKRNLLFKLNQAIGTPFILKLLSVTPILGFGLEGLLNEWNWWTIGGCLFGVYFAIRCVNIANFYKAHEAYEINVSKNLATFQFAVCSNYFTLRWEKAILKAQRKTFEQRFRQKMKDGSLPLQPEQLAEIQKLTDEELSRQINMQFYSKKVRHLEIERTQIKSISFINEKQLRKLIKQRYREMRKVSNTSVLQNYNTLKDQNKILVFQTWPIEGESIMFFAPIHKNQDTKFEEYLKALGEGKTIATF